MEPKAISPKEVRDLIEHGKKVTFIDCRNADAWSHSDQQLPGAIRIPTDETLARADEIPKDGVAVSYCT